jgi:LuxR family transcriptional regulator, maltose regulon positive regulatory protein
VFESLLQTKLYMPPNRSDWVERPRLLEKLDSKRPLKLILVSAPAGYGKTTLIISWLQQQAGAAVCWLSLDEDDSDPQQFFRYLAAAVQPLPDVQSSLPHLLQSNQTIPAKTLMKAFVHDVVPVSSPFYLILDDYHAIDSAEIDKALAALLDLMPPQMTLVLTSRSDPGFPISRLRARGELIELRADEMRFTEAEAAQFLQKTMGLTLPPDQIAALEARTEGWIAGLQMAALSMQNRASGDLDDFVNNFTGSHRFVLDYLVEEVLHQQPASVQTFLLQTSILDQLSGPLCDTVLDDPAISGQATLESFERANLFLVPLDNERRWYRYHHLFADLLRQRLSQQGDKVVNGLHGRASQWYEDNGLELEAFHHAASAHDIERAQRLMEGAGVPLHFRGGVTPVLNWLGSLETAVLDARPALWVMYASALASIERNSTIEQKLQAAEAAIAAATDQQDLAPDDVTRNLIGHIAALRGSLAVGQHQVATIIAQAHRALEYLHPDNLAVRTAVAWQLGVAYQLQGDRHAASQAYAEAIAASRTSGNHLFDLVATIGLGQVQEAETQLHLAADSYRHILQTVGESPLPASCDAYLGLARIHYEWNDLDAAQQDAELSLDLAQQTEEVDTPVACELFLAQLKLAQGDAAGAAALLMPVEQFVHRHNFDRRISEVAALQILILLRQDNLAAAADLAQIYDLPLSQARIHLAQDNPAAALALLEPLRQQAQDNRWQKERLQVLVLQALVYQAVGEVDTAVSLLVEALMTAEPGGYIRLFIDEGRPMRTLLQKLKDEITPPVPYIDTLLAAFDEPDMQSSTFSPQPLIDPLSERELEILALITAGLKNKEIAEQLVISLNTVLYHNKNIYGKLGVNKRALAIARARELNLIE